MDATRILSDFAHNLRYEQLSQKAIDTTKMYIADYCAACFAGIKVNTVFNEAVFHAVAGMGGIEEAAVFGSEIKLPAENAAFMNAVYAHGADMDDGNRKAMGHVAAHVMSAVFALAESLDSVSWEEVFTAINVGYEVYNRIGAAAQPGLVHRGFHSTGTAGAVACGAACAKLLGLDSDGIYNAMAIAAIQASGLLIIAESGQSCKPLNPANAAKAGILSAKIAKAGVKGPVYPLESKKGWFHAMTDKVNENMITEGLGEIFTICESYLKPYPSCRHTHCGIEAAISIREEMLQAGDTVEEIKAIRLYIYNNAIQIAGQIKIPAVADEAKFSIHYSLAKALLEGNFTLDDLDAMADDMLQSVVEKIELIADPSMEDTKSGVRGSRLEVELKNSRTYQKTVLLPKGDAANPFTWQDMERKMTACTAGISSVAEASVITERIRNLNTNARFSNIVLMMK